MGLDQDLMKINKEGGRDIEVKYWRKNNQLQGFFEHYYDQQNCENTNVTEELVEKLLEEIDKGLPATSGFFYGNWLMSEEETQELKELFEEVLNDIKTTGARYYYTCSY